MKRIFQEQLGVKEDSRKELKKEGRPRAEESRACRGIK